MSPLSNGESLAIRDAVVGRMNGYAAAFRSLDAEKIAAFYADDPAFRAYPDGQFFTQAERTRLIRTIVAADRR